MENLLAFSPLDFQHFGVTCPCCSTEVVFNLSDSKALMPKKCVVCGYGPQALPPSHPQWVWLDFLKKMKEISYADQIRFYVKPPSESHPGSLPGGSKSHPLDS